MPLKPSLPLPLNCTSAVTCITAKASVFFTVCRGMDHWPQHALWQQHQSPTGLLAAVESSTHQKKKALRGLVSGESTRHSDHHGTQRSTWLWEWGEPRPCFNAFDDNMDHRQHRSWLKMDNGPRHCTLQQQRPLPQVGAQRTNINMSPCGSRAHGYPCGFRLQHRFQTSA